MKYSNRELKIDQVINYFNDDKINLIPPFQRGTVWNLKLRQRLIANMIQMRPIPAIFLYKQEAGSKFSYNILDGKQRLESLLLFIGDQRADMSVTKVDEYFFGKPARKDANFKVRLDGTMRSFADLEEGMVREFREYAIPTIEIDLSDENSGIDEVVNLFIDINQFGVKVTRFDVIKALGKDPLFKQVFDLVARLEKRKKTQFYKAKNTSFTRVLKKLSVVERLQDNNSKVDRMWERLVEIALFSRNQHHRAPVDILKGLIGQAGGGNPRLSKAELRKLKNVFDLLAFLYKNPAIAQSKLATDQPQFYTLVTTLLATNVADLYTPMEFRRRVGEFAKLAGATTTPGGKLGAAVREYRELASKQTTHPNRREKRQALLVDALDRI